jgi:1,4-alpha-glucan branching enzyme
MVTGKRKAAGVTKEKNSKPKKINFEIIAPEAETAFLVGDFNEWNISAHPCKRNAKGVWKTSIKLVPGRYEYRFLIDGEWRNDPKSSAFASNPFGSDNCVINLD